MRACPPIHSFEKQLPPALRLCDPLLWERASLVAQTVKNPPAVWETRVQSLGREGALEEGMATHSSVLAGDARGWRLMGYSPQGGKE